MTKLKDRIANQIVTELLGTCNSHPDDQALADALWSLNKISNKTIVKEMPRIEKIWGKIENHVCDVIDSQMFLCDDCGWWCGLEEMADTNDGRKCEDCHNE